MPRAGQLIATEVWEAATRVLTGGTNLNDITAAEVWAAATRALTNPSGVFSDATRTLTDISAEEIFDLPIFDSVYPVGTFSSSATGGAFGSWTQLIADVGVGKRLIAVILNWGDSLSAQWEVEIGEGAAGAEVAVARLNGTFLRLSSAGYPPCIVVPVWRALTDNARISARARNVASQAMTYTAGLMVA